MIFYVYREKLQHLKGIIYLGRHVNEDWNHSSEVKIRIEKEALGRTDKEEEVILTVKKKNLILQVYHER